MRTAYFCEPKTSTWATPLTIEIRCARIVSAYSSTVESGRVSEVRAKRSTEKLAGFTLRYDGGLGMVDGKSRAARAIIDCTSCAAASMLRLRLNCKVICVRPRVLAELMESRPAIVENCFSRGVATADAMVSGLAPGRVAVTVMVGKSTVGKSLTGNALYPMAPKMRIPSITSVVVTGRRMKSQEMFMTHLAPALYACREL